MLRLLPFASLALSLLVIVRVVSFFVAEIEFIHNTWIPHPYLSAPIALLLSIVAFVAESPPLLSTVALAISAVLSSLLLFLFLNTWAFPAPLDG